MEPVDLNTIVSQVRGRWVGPAPPPPVRVAEVGTDSRTLPSQALFIALRGERHDGHCHVEEARRRGAVASIVSEARLAELPPAGGPYVAVDDPLSALERLASWNRDRLKLAVVGITGSVGKTSTKEFTGTVLAGRFQVKTAPRSFNNRLGVALTLLSASPTTEVLVVELATSAPGELSHLSRLVRPDRVVLTEIAPVHLQGLGSLEGVVAAKAEVFEGLAPEGHAFLRHGVFGFEHFRSRVRRFSTFGWGAGDYAVTACQRVSLSGSPGGDKPLAPYGYHFTLNGTENFLLPVAGRHNVINAAAAIAVARDLGMRWEEIRASLTECRLPPLRLQVVEEGGVLVVDDSYNASPRSVEAAMDEWSSLDGKRNGYGPGDGPKVAVLGDMLELGAESRRHHEEVGVRLATAGARLVVTVGEDSRWVLEAYRRAGGAGETAHFAAASQALPLLKEKLRRGDHLLVKGSRRIGLDGLVEDLRRWLRSAREAH
jgi:UDP-N-acetylmuramoyl-tripeptide--D-alanyl-D-alanine ligase